MTFGLRRAKILGELFVQLVSKIFNLCSHDPPTSQTDRRTDDMRLQDRALHYSASRAKNRFMGATWRIRMNDPCTWYQDALRTARQ